MDAGIADAINRQDARLICEQLDAWDAELGYTQIAPWHRAPIADTLMSDAPDKYRADRAWLIGSLAARTPGLRFDGAPADADWDGLFASFRAEITARRAPETPHVGLAETQPVEVV